MPSEPVQAALPREPDPTSFRYQVKLSLFDRLSSFRKISKIAAAEDLLEADRADWRARCESLRVAHQANIDAHGVQCKRLQDQHAQAVTAWKVEKSAYDDEQARKHADVDAFRARYEAKELDAIIEY